ncbi:glycosyltransferase family 4 protein [Citrobacter portucalensis]|uniref:glycosyltransferase family 4 protein n=1 Tax=Citrobacter portucalensis TaxID=1639133 RepID=UPI00397BCA8B
MKIAIIGTTAQSLLGFRREMIRKLVLYGHTVYAFSLDYNEKYKKEIRSMGAIPVDYKFSRAGMNPLKDLHYTYLLYQKLKALNLNVVLSYFSKPSIFGTIAAYYAGTSKRVAMLEGLGYAFTEQPEGIKFKTKLLKNIQILLYKVAFRKVNNLIVLNNDDKEELIKLNCISSDKVEVLGGIGLDLEKYKRSTPPLAPVSFIFIGRLLKEKGIHEFISAAKEIKSKYPDVEFNVLGDIDPENPGSITKKELDNLLSNNIINYPGHVDNVADWIARSSVFVLPSYREGYPRSTQEAMAIGRAVITTDVPGCRDTVVEGVNGFIVQRWSAKDLVLSMDKFITKTELITLMGDESYNLALEHFDANKTNEKIINILC